MTSGDTLGTQTSEKYSVDNLRNIKQVIGIHLENLLEPAKAPIIELPQILPSNEVTTEPQQ